MGGGKGSGLRARLERSLDRAGIALTWWVPVGVTVFGVVLMVAAIVSRAAGQSPTQLVLAGVLQTATPLLWLVTGRIAPQWLKALTVLAAVAVLLTHPVVPDFAPVLLVVLAAEIATTTRPAVAFTVAGASIAVLVVAAVRVGLVGGPVYMVAVLLGLTGGFMFHWYVRALAAERGRQDAARERAVLAERQRIAGEVHDVVGHSLSITLLHLTGARRALQQDRDVDEALDALTEAEQVGRAAMADVRRTVGLLATSPGTRPLPGADDIAALVESTRVAGVDVRYEQRGDLTGVTETAGLGLYRIAQESLANIAKHAPHAAAEVLLQVDRGGARLTVRNELPATAPIPESGGSGLTGMSARATQLRASLRVGPDEDHWIVDVRVP